MKLIIKPFSELSNRELYEILRLRSEIFIVEQRGCYQDLDGIDYESIHLFILDDAGILQGCLRIFPKEGFPDTVQIGRLVVRTRRKGIGTQLMEAAQKEAIFRYHASNLFLTGRRSAREFYESCGYTASLPACYATEDEALYFEFSRSLHQ